MRIGLVGCGKGKLAYPAPARDLYTGELFRRASAYCASSYDAWYVLSALHGLVHPDDVLAPYDATLVGAKPKDAARWAERVVGQLRSRGHLGDELVLHAGDAYRRPLGRRGLRLQAPLAGLGIGEQLAWYGRHAPGQAAMAFGEAAG